MIMIFLQNLWEITFSS